MLERSTPEWEESREIVASILRRMWTVTRDARDWEEALDNFKRIQQQVPDLGRYLGNHQKLVAALTYEIRKCLVLDEVVSDPRFRAKLAAKNLMAKVKPVPPPMPPDVKAAVEDVLFAARADALNVEAEMRLIERTITEGE